MKTNTHTDIIVRSSLALALALFIWFPTHARSAEPTEEKTMTETQMMERCQAMKAQKEKMKEDMKAQNAELTGHVTKMNSAPADKKVDVMAAVVTHMLEQRIAMDERKTKMEEEMMQHMMQHMQMGKDSMSKCPMMNGMKGMGAMKGMAEK